ncbi:hypothetical protein ES703_101063 [subsurface metagenome]
MEKILIVSHSMGGLVSRAYMEGMAINKRADISVNPNVAKVEDAADPRRQG